MSLRPPAVLAALVLVLSACTPSASPSSGAPSASTTAAPSASTSSAATASATQPASTVPPAATGPDALALQPFATGLSAPVNVAAAGDGSGRLYVNEQAGRIRVVEPDGRVRPQPFLDITGRVASGGERGLLGLAFHPDFEHNRRFFVDYTRSGPGGDNGDTVIAEARASADGLSADPATLRVLLVVDQPYANHNGGQLAFGPDGYLYIAFGDGGSGGDPHGNAQNTNVLLGKILRLDVDNVPSGKTYGIPNDNPFAPGGIRPGKGAPEVWAYGLRNPWRFSFDRARGDLYIGDVGQGAWEEIDRQPGDSQGGDNYGWNVMEGRHCYGGGECDNRLYSLPIAEYGHDKGQAVTGGYVYRGSRQPQLRGVYVFADAYSGRLFTLQVDAGSSTPKQVLRDKLFVSTFGEADDGEIYAADLAGGGLYRVVLPS